MLKPDIGLHPAGAVTFAQGRPFDWKPPFPDPLVFGRTVTQGRETLSVLPWQKKSTVPPGQLKSLLPPDAITADVRLNTEKRPNAIASC